MYKRQTYQFYLIRELVGKTLLHIEGLSTRDMEDVGSVSYTHLINQQAEVLKTGAQNLGQMGSMDMGGNGGGSMNPAGIMTGMAMGGAIGQQMAGRMNQMCNAMNGQMNTPPPPPNVQ